MISGKKVVFVFFGSIALVALLLLPLVLYVRGLPNYEVEQRKMGLQLSLAYQKYRKDFKGWPDDVHEATYNFKSENEELGGKVRKAIDDWGMRVELEDPGQKPMLHISFTKPKNVERIYPLENKDRR